MSPIAQLPMPDPDRVLILRIELKWITPTIWRQVAVPENITLGNLHRVIQATMGWTDAHLHEFEIAGDSYGISASNSGWKPPVVAEQRQTLISVLRGKRTFRYVYDFRDGWEHVLRVEKVIPAGVCPQLPYCIDGANARPPEDIGGVLGYDEFLTALNDSAHPKHDNVLEWFGDNDFDPTTFDCVRINRSLKQIRLQ
ncbi:plasmid pRiA4b ORF-3 family protein [Pseudomonas sp. MWU13-2105]|uniref:plasmid pRiA4b ORF-3 family protein n=1 Tax=Pseudomonas sp. MWU13-2105 TaxID=2935074 RepID=UPI00200EA9AD|nr:plasmid pRiA4b ORF-3 family protein [Pseudomonas sp. MWU13-2105]